MFKNQNFSRNSRNYFLSDRFSDSFSAETFDFPGSYAVFLAHTRFSWLIRMFFSTEIAKTTRIPVVFSKNIIPALLTKCFLFNWISRISRQIRGFPGSYACFFNRQCQKQGIFNRFFCKYIIPARFKD